MSGTEYDLERFVDAQRATFDQAEKELRAGQKRTHWMWYIFPQLRGLGLSSTSQFYGISGREEAQAYLAHTILGARLISCTSIVLAHHERTVLQIFGSTDAMKFHSSMTLFEAAAAGPSVFGTIIQAFYESKRDARTIQLLRPSPGAFNGKISGS